MIRGITFATWSEIAPSGLEGLGQARFLLPTSAAIIIFMLGSVYAVNMGRKGINWPIQVIACTIIAIFVVVLPWCVYESVRGRRKDLPLPTGRYSVVFAVGVAENRSSDRGELRFSGPWMEFRGSRTFIRLAARDFERYKGSSIMSGGLVLPPEFPRMTVTVALAEGGRSEFQMDLDRWRGASAPLERSIFPPLSYGASLPDFKRSFFGVTTAGLVLALVLYGFLALTSTNEVSMMGSVCGMIGLMWIFWLSLALPTFSILATGRKIAILRADERSEV